MPSLAERQAAITAYLADPHSFAAGTADALLGPDAHIDASRLRAMGSMGLRKRSNKIRDIFPSTAAALGDQFPRVMREFAHRYPPCAFQALFHAEQFCDYLSKTLDQDRALPPFVADLAAFERAVLRVNQPEETVPYLGKSRLVNGRRVSLIARYDVLELLHDVRPHFDRSVARKIEERRFHVVVINPTPQGSLRVLEIAPEMSCALSALKTAVPDDDVPCSEAALDALLALRIVLAAS